MAFAGFVSESTPKRVKFRASERPVGKMTNYPVGDFIIRLKNAALAGNKEFEAKETAFLLEVCKTLKKMGFVENFKEKGGQLTVSLVFKNKKPLILGAKLISKPGLRVYKGADELAEIRGPSTFLISTPKGLLSSREAIKQRVGGEVIAELW